MPEKFKKMVRGIEKSGKPEDQAYAIATSAWEKSHGGKTPKESVNESYDVLSTKVGDRWEETKASLLALGMAESDPKFYSTLLKEVKKSLKEDTFNSDFDPDACQREDDPKTVSGEDMTPGERTFNNPETYTQYDPDDENTLDPDYIHNDTGDTTPEGAGDPKVKESVIREAADSQEWEWRGRSTVRTAVAWAELDAARIFQFRFALSRSKESHWWKAWDPLAAKGVNSVVSLSIKKVGSDLVKSDNPKPYIVDTVGEEDIPDLLPVAKKIVADYLKVFNAKKLFQYLCLRANGTDKTRIKFYGLLSGELSSLGLKRDLESEQKCENHIRIYQQAVMFLLENSSGPKEKPVTERVGDSLTGRNTPSIINTHPGITGQNLAKAPAENPDFTHERPSAQVYSQEIVMVREDEMNVATPKQQKDTGRFRAKAQALADTKATGRNFKKIIQDKEGLLGGLGKVANMVHPTSGQTESTLSFAAVVQEMMDNGYAFNEAVAYTSKQYKIPMSEILEDCDAVGMIDEEVTSSSFGGPGGGFLPADAKHDWKKDWAEHKGGSKQMESTELANCPNCNMDTGVQDSTYGDYTCINCDHSWGPIGTSDSRSAGLLSDIDCDDSSKNAMDAAESFERQKEGIVGREFNYQRPTDDNDDIDWPQDVREPMYNMDPELDTDWDEDIDPEERQEERPEVVRALWKNLADNLTTLGVTQESLNGLSMTILARALDLCYGGRYWEAADILEASIRSDEPKLGREDMPMPGYRESYDDTMKELKSGLLSFENHLKRLKARRADPQEIREREKEIEYLKQDIKDQEKAGSDLNEEVDGAAMETGGSGDGGQDGYDVDGESSGGIV